MLRSKLSLMEQYIAEIQSITDRLEDVLLDGEFLSARYVTVMSTLKLKLEAVKSTVSDMSEELEMAKEDVENGL